MTGSIVGDLALFAACCALALLAGANLHNAAYYLATERWRRP